MEIAHDVGFADTEATRVDDDPVNTGKS